MQSTTADLVTDTKFRVEFYSDLVHRFTFQSSNTPGQYVRRQERLDVWKKEKAVGSGSYGSVWVHRCLTSENQGELQAVKMVNKSQLSSGGIDFCTELEAIAKFSQKKYLGLFVEYFGWYENEESMFIAMEYIQHGDLGAHLTIPLPEKDAREIIFQIAEGLEHLHRNGFVHRDLKPENVFVVAKGPQWWVKIGDFGFSKRIKEDSSLRSMVGTRLFLAPEVQMIYPPGTDETSAVFHYTEKVDIWSLGVMTFYILFHEFPFTSNTPYALPKYVRGGPFPFPVSPPVQMPSEESYRFMIAAMAPDANTRLSARGVLESNWLKQRAFDCVSGMESLQISGKTSSSISRRVTQAQTTQSRESQGTITPSNYGKTSSTSISPSNRIVSTLMATNVSLNPANPIPPQSNAIYSGYHERGEDPLAGQKYKTTQAMFNQASGGQKMNYPEAEVKYQLAFDGFKAAIGWQNEETLSCLNDLGNALYYQTRFAEAECTWRQAFQGFDEAFGSHHPKTLSCLQHVGIALYGQARYIETESTCRLVYWGRKSTLGPHHKDTLSTLQDIGDALFCQNKYIEAEAEYRQVYRARQRALGERHQDTRLVLHKIGKALEFQTKCAEYQATI
ncbi:hypothetical protein N7517_010910 [Penicillium concentricum]|uniref:Serine/threonine-protein kinase ATG1 n=1 Tax=Penicillium concentricum TaxID=293559 RepID=A0A9W9R9Y6_9EURO|nr:uncharacterized protein N7517_010910 [Penicillium concentricum]KAJ5356301.1 hypothetical protein N7517_010910 [Penicillium concentricum]